MTFGGSYPDKSVEDILKQVPNIIERYSYLNIEETWKTAVRLFLGAKTAEEQRSMGRPRLLGQSALLPRGPAGDEAGFPFKPLRNGSYLNQRVRP